MINPFVCPLSSELFEFPMIAADGYTYERCAIEVWIKMKGEGLVASPMSNDSISMDTLVPNAFVADTMNRLIQIGVDILEDISPSTAMIITKSFENGNISIKCPLTLLPIGDPVVYRDGVTYERAAIEEYTLYPEELISNR
jgi:hypothetical protein